jgi:hypothetical protein
MKTGRVSSLSGPRSNLWFGGAKTPGPPLPVWPQPAQGPLPAIPQTTIANWPEHPHSTPGVWCQDGHTYDQTFQVAPPTQPDREWWRGDYFGMRVPGIPLLPGMAGYTVSSPPWNQNTGAYCPPIMAMDLLRYAAKGMWDCVDAILDAHVAHSYTHFQYSVCHANAWGLTIDQAVKTAIRVKEKIRYLDAWWLGSNWSRYWDDGSIHEEMRDRDRDYWAPILQPWIDAFKSNGVIDCACKGWQLDGYNTQSRRDNSKYANPWQSMIEYFGEQFTQQGISVSGHFMNEACMVLQDSNDPHPMSRQQAWKNKAGHVRYVHHQGDVYCPIDEYQARYVDTLKMFGDGSCGTFQGDQTFRMICCEHSAQSQFDLWCSNDENCVKGLRLTQTHASTVCAGFSGGARNTNGSPV